jgi:polar amino acid transport system substrate-binding protein
MKPYNQTSEALAALRAGEVEAVFFDSPVAEAQVKTTYQDTKIIEVIPTGEQYGIAVNKDNPELLAAINASLAKLKGDGTFEELLAKHFG